VLAKDGPMKLNYDEFIQTYSVREFRFVPADWTPDDDRDWTVVEDQEVIDKWTILLQSFGTFDHERELGYPVAKDDDERPMLVVLQSK
jgi:hypothetical protein